MKKQMLLFLIAVFLILPVWITDVFAEDVAPPGDTIHISGTVRDYHDEPVKEARVRILVNGEPHEIIVDHEKAEETETSSLGTYQLSFTLGPARIESSKIQVEISKTSFAKTTIDLGKEDFAQKGQSFFTVKDLKISPWLGPAFYIATIVFLVIYILISFEILHRTIAAMLGAALMLLITYTFGTLNSEYHIISFERAMQAIDMNVIFLLMGMMIIVGVLKHTGVFQWCAYMSFKLARGNVMILAIISMFFIAITSAFLDNVTTMLLYTPVLIEIALALKISPLSLLIPGVMASNVGGTATLIGDPPNIMIGSYTGFTFMMFVQNLTLVCIVATVALAIYNKFFYGKAYAKGKVEDVDKFIEFLKEEYKITDKKLLGYGL
ncbi:MAG: SLC13 family permease, partial [Nitrospirota bacterium]